MAHAAAKRKKKTHAPLVSGMYHRLREDANDIPATAKRKGLTCSEHEAYQEKKAAEEHFELGTWLYYYSTRVGRIDGLSDRIDCLIRLFEAGITAPGYQFFTVFDFGDRQFDAIFEMGDADDVKKAVMVVASKNPHGAIAMCCKEMGWM